MKGKSNIIIKKLKPSEHKLAKELFTFYQLDDGEKPMHVSASYLQKRLKKKSFHVIVALDGDKVAGGLTAYEMAMYKGDFKEMFLYEIAVKPRYRKQGIARKLIEALKKICREKGIEIMFVGTSPSNTAAMELYKNTGGIPDYDTLWITYTIPVKK